MNTTPLRFPMTAAALAVLLVACGGGGGSSDQAVSSSPNAPDPTIATSATSTDSGTKAGSTASGTTDTANASAESGNTGSTPPATPAPQPATTTDVALSDAGVSSNVVRTFLESRIGMAGPHFTPMIDLATGRYGSVERGANNGTPHINISTRLDPSNYQTEYRNGIPYPTYIFQRLNGTAQYWHTTDIPGRDGANANTKVPFRETGMRVNMTADAEQWSLADTMTVAVFAPCPTWNCGAASNAPEEVVTLQASPTNATFKNNALLPFGTVVQRWTGANGQSVELKVEGRCDIVNVGEDGQINPAFEKEPGVELCWNTNLGKVKQQSCFMLAVTDEAGPAGDASISWGFQELVDDRSTYAGESGTRVWRDGGYRRCAGKGGVS